MNIKTMDIQVIIKSSVKFIEMALAVLVLIGVLLYIFNSAAGFISADWGNAEIFYNLIYEVLLVTIGLEVARMLVTHNYESILELLAFVIARKMLKPDITTVDIALGVFSFILIILATRYLFPIIRHGNTTERIGDKS